MNNLKYFNEINESNNYYDPNKEYSIKYITQIMANRKNPYYMRRELSKLKPVPRKNKMGEIYYASKISERLFHFLFNKKF